MPTYNPTIRKSAYQSPLGAMTLAASDAGLAGAWFDDQRHMPDTAGWPSAPRDAVLRRAADQLGEYFDARRDTFDLPLDLRSGTAFQQLVWQALLCIPFGGNTTYGALSSSIGKAAAVRAAGSAIGRNPLGIIVPCHRVLGADGSLTGYAGGLERKAALLRLEARKTPVTNPA